MSKVQSDSAMSVLSGNQAAVSSHPFNEKLPPLKEALLD